MNDPIAAAHSDCVKRAWLDSQRFGYMPGTNVHNVLWARERGRLHELGGPYEEGLDLQESLDLLAFVADRTNGKARIVWNSDGESCVSMDTYPRLQDQDLWWVPRDAVSLHHAVLLAIDAIERHREDGTP